jgi:hypothetical protein
MRGLAKKICRCVVFCWLLGVGLVGSAPIQVLLQPLPRTLPFCHRLARYLPLTNHSTDSVAILGHRIYKPFVRHSKSV